MRLACTVHDKQVFGIFVSCIVNTKEHCVLVADKFYATRGLYHRYPGVRLVIATTCAGETAEVRSRIECINFCQSLADCKSVNFIRKPQSSSGKLSCLSMASTLPLGANQTLIKDDKWDWLYMDE